MVRSWLDNWLIWKTRVLGLTLFIWIQCFRNGKYLRLCVRVSQIIHFHVDLCSLDFFVHYACIVLLIRKKKASVKKNMQILHGLSPSREISVNERLEQEERLLKAAYGAAKSRVVVKRPRNAPVLGERLPGDSPIPTSSICGPVSRWDVYAKP